MQSVHCGVDSLDRVIHAAEASAADLKQCSVKDPTEDSVVRTNGDLAHIHYVLLQHLHFGAGTPFPSARQCYWTKIEEVQLCSPSYKKVSVSVQTFRYPSPQLRRSHTTVHIYTHTKPSNEIPLADLRRSPWVFH